MSAPADAVLFHGGYAYMYSNFASFMVEWKGILWTTSEHAYQAAKFYDATIRERVELARSAHDSKKIARAHAEYVRQDWAEVCLLIMESIVRAKVAQHPYIAQQLLKTGDRPIIEDSPKDSFWGRGPDWKGQNHLGKIWMKLRAELQVETFHS